MTQNKTNPTRLKVSEFIAAIEDSRKRAECREIMKLMRAVVIAFLVSILPKAPELANSESNIIDIAAVAAANFSVARDH